MIFGPYWVKKNGQVDKLASCGKRIVSLSLNVSAHGREMLNDSVLAENKQKTTVTNLLEERQTPASGRGTLRLMILVVVMSFGAESFLFSIIE